MTKVKNKILQNFEIKKQTLKIQTAFGAPFRFLTSDWMITQPIPIYRSKFNRNTNLIGK